MQITQDEFKILLAKAQQDKLDLTVSLVFHTTNSDSTLWVREPWVENYLSDLREKELKVKAFHDFLLSKTQEYVQCLIDRGMKVTAGLAEAELAKFITWIQDNGYYITD